MRRHSQKFCHYFIEQAQGFLFNECKFIFCALIERKPKEGVSSSLYHDGSISPRVNDCTSPDDWMSE